MGNLEETSPSEASSPSPLATNAAPDETPASGPPTTELTTPEEIPSLGTPTPTPEPSAPDESASRPTETAENTTAPATPISSATPTGSLSITAPDEPVNLGSGAPTGVEGTISGTLGEVRVADTREAGTAAGWVASVSSAGFTASGGLSIPASALSYSAGDITAPGTAIYVPNEQGHLSGSATPVVTASEITGPNYATWNPTITLRIPVGTLAGEYSAIITHSVL
nr:hypothetical protein pA58H3_p48 [Arthrobacter sp.]